MTKITSTKLSGFGTFQSYDTGWVNCSDWTDQTLGDAVGGNVTHGLASNISQLLIKVFISTDGTDNNSFEIKATEFFVDGAGTSTGGITAFQVDTDELTIQTGINGIRYINAVGNLIQINTQNWYYRIKVYKVN